MEKLKRYIIFIIGLYINSFGVSLITKAALGTSPISSIPYVLSLNFPFTLGQFTIFFSILLIVLQLFILGKISSWSMRCRSRYPLPSDTSSISACFCCRI